MRHIGLALAVTAGLVAAPLGARSKTYYEYGGKYYETRQQCLNAKKKARTKGAVIGAVGVGAAAALVGGNFGESALAAGVGALVGSEIGKNSKKC
jgi:hypothetical protein